VNNAAFVEADDIAWASVPLTHRRWFVWVMALLALPVTVAVIGLVVTFASSSGAAGGCGGG
jgi:hypothetical protein